jgi:hypothetical protein
VALYNAAKVKPGPVPDLTPAYKELPAMQNTVAVGAVIQLTGRARTYAMVSMQLKIPDCFNDASAQMSATLDLERMDRLDRLIAKAVLHLARTAKVDDPPTYHRLQTLPGGGPILALVLLYEMHQVDRFEKVGQFLSYARLVRCVHGSAGTRLGSGRKNGCARQRG